MLYTYHPISRSAFSRPVVYKKCNSVDLNNLKLLLLSGDYYVHWCFHIIELYHSLTPSISLVSLFVLFAPPVALAALPARTPKARLAACCQQVREQCPATRQQRISWCETDSILCSQKRWGCPRFHQLVLINVEFTTFSFEFTKCFKLIECWLMRLRTSTFWKISICSSHIATSKSSLLQESTWPFCESLMRITGDDPLKAARICAFVSMKGETRRFLEWGFHSCNSCM